MLVNFAKMHGLGNDFVVIDMITQHVKLHSAHIKRIADRRFGVGCDQVLLIEPPMRPESDFYYRIFNANGLEAEQCGNGARCAAKFVVDSGLVNGTEIVADYCAGHLLLTIEDNNFVKVDMGNSSETKTHQLKVLDHELELHCLSFGNPHAVCVVNDVKNYPVDEIGKKINELDLFPDGVNVEFMQIIDSARIRVRVYERGVGETLACGSGACAATVAGRNLGLLDNIVYVVFSQGELIITAKSHTGSTLMSGPATSVFVGHFRL